MRTLIAERPNTVPVGLGNSRTTIDMDRNESDAWGIEQENAELPRDDGEEDEGNISGGDGGNEDDTTTKAMSTIPTPPTKPQPSQPDLKRGGSSKPDAKPAKKSKVETFADLAEEEERTKQRELDARVAKATEGAAKAQAQVAKIELEKMKLEMKAALKREKWQYKAEKLRMAMEFQGHGNLSNGLYAHHGHGQNMVLQTPFMNTGGQSSATHQYSQQSSPSPFTSQSNLPGLNMTEPENFSAFGNSSYDESSSSSTPYVPGLPPYNVD